MNSLEAAFSRLEMERENIREWSEALEDAKAKRHFNRINNCRLRLSAYILAYECELSHILRVTGLKEPYVKERLQQTNTSHPEGVAAEGRLRCQSQ